MAQPWKLLLSLMLLDDDDDDDDDDDADHVDVPGWINAVSTTVASGAAVVSAHQAKKAARAAKGHKPKDQD